MQKPLKSLKLFLKGGIVVDVLGQLMQAYKKELNSGKRNMKRFGFLFFSLMMFTAIFLIIFILFMLTISFISESFSFSTLGLGGILMILSAAFGYRLIDNWSLFFTITEMLYSPKKKGEFQWEYLKNYPLQKLRFPHRKPIKVILSVSLTIMCLFPIRKQCCTDSFVRLYP